MRALLVVTILGLGAAGAYFVGIATLEHVETQAALYAFIAGLVAWSLATLLLIIGMFAFRGRG